MLQTTAVSFVVMLGSGMMAASPSQVTTAMLRGTVVHQGGGPLVGVRVIATHLVTNRESSASTGEGGGFAIASLTPGVYRVRASLDGFSTVVREEVLLALGQTLRLDLSLSLVGIEEEVRVTAALPMVDLEKRAISSVIGERSIEALPIDGRRFTDFSLLTPGVARDLTFREGVTAASGLSFLGQGPRANNIMVDGLDNNDQVSRGARSTFSQEAIQEFQVLAGSYSAELGKASGGVINIVTKSGSSRVTGSAFYFGRDDRLSARNYFETFDPAGKAIDRGKAPYSRRQWGGTLGGPLAKDEAFFFLSFEKTQIDAANFVVIDETAAAALDAAGFPVELGNVPFAVRSSQLLGKVDLHLAPDHRLTLRGNYANLLDENGEPWGGLVARSRGAEVLRDDWSLAASSTNVLGSRWLSEARFQVARQDQEVDSLDGADGPTLEIAGVASLGRLRTTPQPRDNTRVQVTETVTFFGERHTVKGGFDFDTLDGRGELPLHFGGRFVFAPLPAIPPLGIAQPLSALQAFTLGLPAAYVQGYGDPVSLATTRDLSLFVQDDWQVGPRLFLHLGLRYQRRFWPSTSYRTNGFERAYSFPEDRNDWGPRLAVSFDPIGDGRTSVRVAYGVFYDLNLTALASVPDILDGREGVRTFVGRLPASLSAWRAPGRALPEPESFSSTQFAIDPGYRSPLSHHASLGLDRELSEDLALSADFAYVYGKNRIGTIDYNPILPDLGPGRRPLDVGGQAGTSSSVLQYTSFGESWYRGLLLGLRKRYRNRSQLLVSYSLSKSEDTTSDFQSEFIVEDNGRGRASPDDPGLPREFDPRRERGPSLNDQRHRLVFGGSLELPWGIALSGIATVASGRPYDILAGTDLNGDGNGGNFPPDRARRILSDPSSSVMRHAGRMPAETSLDLRVSRPIPFGRRAMLEPIVEIFNLFNRTNFTDVNEVFGTGAYPTEPLPSFGQFTAAAAPRQIQLALKLRF